eukprot:gene17678-biopygen11954
MLKKAGIDSVALGGRLSASLHAVHEQGLWPRQHPLAPARGRPRPIPKAQPACAARAPAPSPSAASLGYHPPSIPVGNASREVKQGLRDRAEGPSVSAPRPPPRNNWRPPQTGLRRRRGGAGEAGGDGGGRPRHRGGQAGRLTICVCNPAGLIGEREAPPRAEGRRLGRLITGQRQRRAHEFGGDDRRRLTVGAPGAPRADRESSFADSSAHPSPVFIVLG